jgi:hypothetical protein
VSVLAELLNSGDRDLAESARRAFERVHMSSFAGASEWLKSEPLGTVELGAVSCS